MVVSVEYDVGDNDDCYYGEVVAYVRGVDNEYGAGSSYG